MKNHAEDWGDYVPSKSKPKNKQKRIAHSRDSKRNYEEPSHAYSDNGAEV